ncbi:MAG: Transcriptional regulator SlmA, TetR family [Candidatus Saccharicenans subterraneus]|uniref:Transcriptional regulator SlmA, TetR family n=1 Tax=Candidatus Saccharicenans subterraneus TaxID=2508984 RepID=A0A3E2BQV5_9BACT|nr:MAG: Transcriptional regulator SlmA, TetR family [Candidatus Saccharicenans subterraneum]
MKKAVFFQTPESRKGDIITSALKIIDQKGVKGLTVARLAQEVGFVESALYRHFKSKRDLVSFILDNILQDAWNYLAEVEEKTEDSLEALKQLIYLFLSFLEQFPGIFKIIYSDEIYLGDEELQDKIDGIISEIVVFLKKVIQKAINQKKLKADLDVTVAAMHFLGLIYTAFSYWTIKKRRVPLKKISSELLDQYLEGVKA